MSTPNVSFIIVEFHSLEDINKCIASLKAASIYGSYEIIVSSNSCYPQEKQAQLKKNYTNVSWSFNPKNGGFAYAMNQGMKLAQGNYLTILNPDVCIKHGIDQMIRFMNDHPKVGAIAPQIVSPKGVTQDSARPYVTLQSYVWRCLKRVIEKKTAVLDTHMDYNQVQTVDWVIGAFMMVRRAVYENTQGMDENYFMYAEDLDWCTRIRKCGYEIVYYPLAQVEYEGSRSARQSMKYARIFLQSHFYYWRKHGFFYGHPKRQPLFE